MNGKSLTAIRKHVLTLLLDAGKLLVFYLVVRAILQALVPEIDLPVMASIAFFLILMPRIVSAFARFVLAPYAPPLRMVRASDAFAKALYSNLFIIAVIMGAAYALINFNAAMGVPPGATRAGVWFNAAAFLWLGWVIWKHREDLSIMMRGFDEVTPAENWAAYAYPRFALIATAACWALSEALIANGMVQLLREGEHMITLGILLMAPALDTLVRGLVAHLLPPMTGDGELAKKAYKATERSWVRIGRVVALAVVITTISNVWGVAFVDLLVGSANPVNAGLARFSSVLIVGYIAWEGSRLWFNSSLAKEHTEGEGIADDDGSGSEGGGAGASRLSTVLPLLSWFVQVGIVVMTVLSGLSNLGVDVTPLLAGAGILGLAIGVGGSIFGLALAYTIVYNIITFHDWMGQALGISIWDPAVYYFTEIPSRVNHLHAAIIGLGGMLASTLGALWPALRAARMNPVRALRFE